jgi:hypothetical protein
MAAATGFCKSVLILHKFSFDTLKLEQWLLIDKIHGQLAFHVSLDCMRVSFHTAINQFV